ncbi:hypothetical protein QAD02_011984 [Eretmocerus hayati]|uniref:Uncharacterized protein n=1 Tax=Eretmocerus hayati TaxID=131215 RepID=A0ACC2NZC4_9HYME|nr:hypothetical protein QAD02_011984 [Eretmocerus hayati]
MSSRALVDARAINARLQEVVLPRLDELFDQLAQGAANRMDWPDQPRPRNQGFRFNLNRHERPEPRINELFAALLERQMIINPDRQAHAYVDDVHINRAQPPAEERPAAQQQRHPPTRHRRMGQ